MKDPYEMTPDELQAACDAHPDYQNYKNEIKQLREKFTFSVCDKCNGECIRDIRCKKDLTMYPPKYATVCLTCGYTQWKHDLKDEIKEIYQIE